MRNADETRTTKWWRGGNIRTFSFLGLQAAALLALGVLGFKSVRAIDLLPPRTGDAVLYPRYTAAAHLVQRIRPDERVVTVGWTSVDETGNPVAYDDGTMIFFLDRKGFVIPREKANMAEIRKLALRGAKCLVEKRDSALAAEARRTLESVAVFGEYELFAIR